MSRLHRFLRAGSGICLAVAVIVWFPGAVGSQPNPVRPMPPRVAPARPGGQFGAQNPRAGYGMSTPVFGSFTGYGSFSGGGATGLTTPSRAAGFRGGNGALGGGFTGMGNFSGGANANSAGFGNFSGGIPALNGFNQNPVGATVVSQPNVAMPLLSAPILYNGLNGAGMTGFNGFGGMSGFGGGYAGMAGIQGGGFNGFNAGFAGMAGIQGGGFNGFGAGVNGFNGFGGGYGKPGDPSFGGFNGGHGL